MVLLFVSVQERSTNIYLVRQKEKSVYFSLANSKSELFFMTKKADISTLLTKCKNIAYFSFLEMKKVKHSISV
jgi:hypothetical protein